MSIYQVCISAPFGYVNVLSAIDCVTKVELLAHKVSSSPKLNEFAFEAQKQIKEYLKTPTFKFDLPIDVKGSAYRRLVWGEIVRIPAKETRTYGEIAALIGSSARAVNAWLSDKSSVKVLKFDMFELSRFFCVTILSLLLTSCVLFVR